MLMSLLLFPAAMAFLRVFFRPNQHPQPNPLFEMELATCVMKTHQHDLSARGKVSGVSSEKNLLDWKMCIQAQALILLY